MDECICNEYDGKGKSVGGMPCSVHQESFSRKVRWVLYNWAYLVFGRTRHWKNQKQQKKGGE